MDKQTFWGIIESTKLTESDEGKHKVLLDKMISLKVKEIFLFDGLVHKLRGEIWNESNLADELSSRGFQFTDSGFDYFISWLILQGEEKYNQVLENPAVMRVWYPDLIRLPENPDIYGIAETAYEKKRELILSSNEKETGNADENIFIMLMEEDFYKAFDKIKQSK